MKVFKTRITVGIPVITKYRNDPTNRKSTKIPNASPIFPFAEFGWSL
jgi:hypothetical protein